VPLDHLDILELILWVRDLILLSAHMGHLLVSQHSEKDLLDRLGVSSATQQWPTVVFPISVIGGFGRVEYTRRTSTLQRPINVEEGV
jgi:hypothetical protein